MAVAAGNPASKASAEEAAPAEEAALKTFAVEIKIGPNWDLSNPPNEQAFFAEHSAHLKHLRDEGHLILGMRYSDIGLLLVAAKSLDAVRSMMEADPSMEAGTFVFEVHGLNVFYPGQVLN